jgi:hypothetical protein
MVLMHGNYKTTPLEREKMRDSILQMPSQHARSHARRRRRKTPDPLLAKSESIPMPRLGFAPFAAQQFVRIITIPSTSMQVMLYVSYSEIPIPLAIPNLTLQSKPSNPHSDSALTKAYHPHPTSPSPSHPQTHHPPRPHQPHLHSPAPSSSSPCSRAHGAETHQHSYRFHRY